MQGFRSQAALCSPIALTLILASGCGTKSTGKAPIGGGGPDDASTVASDAETSTTIVAAQMDEAATALNAGDGSSNSAAVALLGRSNLAADDIPIKRDRVCAVSASVNGGNAEVTISYSGTGTAKRKVVAVSEAAGGKEVRDWTSTEGTVVCTADNKYAKIKWSSPIAVGTAMGVNGLTLKQSTARTRSISSNWTAGGVAKSRSVVTGESGTRTVTWSEAAATPLVTTKTVDINVTKTYELTKADGTTVNLDAIYATTKQMNITVSRNADGTPTSHQVNSGTMSVLKTGKFYVTNDYANVVYSTTATDPCVPQSGTIVSTTFKSNAAADLATPLKTVTYTFDATNGPAAVVAGGTAAEGTEATTQLSANINHKCDFVDGD